MASSDNHFRQALLNFEQLKVLTIYAPTPDWMITISYYTALHLLNGHLANFGLHPITHQETHKHLRQRRIGITAELLRNYGELQSFSRDARYIGTLDQDYSVPNIDEQDVKDALEYLNQVLLFVCSLYPDRSEWNHLSTLIYEGEEYFKLVHL